MSGGRAGLRTEDLTFGYSAGRPVVRGLSVAFEPGKTVLLGPNGAGKTTLLKLMTGLLAPAGGAIQLDGQRRSRRELARVVGLMPQQIVPMPGLTVLEAVQYAAWLGGLSTSAASSAAREAIAAVGLEDQLHQKSNRLSGGQLRRLGLASALSATDRVLLLDEPTAGLDPAQRFRFREVLANLPDDLTVVISTHQIDDIEDTYDQVRVIAQGTLRWQGTPAELLALAPEGSRQQTELAYLRLVGEDA